MHFRGYELAVIVGEDWPHLPYATKQVKHCKTSDKHASLGVLLHSVASLARAESVQANMDA